VALGKEVRGVPSGYIENEIGIPKQKLYYLESKGFLRPQKYKVGAKEFRFYPPEDQERLRAIKPYLDQGFKYEAAIKRALEDLKQKSKAEQPEPLKRKKT
jgi:DNA-binding transcriptional MerR regulator